MPHREARPNCAARVKSRVIRLLCLLLAVCLHAAEPEPRWRTLNHDARLAIDAKDYPKLHATLTELKPLLPGNPRITYNLAASEAMLGNREAALAILRQWAGMGLVYGLSTDSDFVALREAPEYRAILQRVEENKKPVRGAVVAFAIARRTSCRKTSRTMRRRAGFL